MLYTIPFILLFTKCDASWEIPRTITDSLTCKQKCKQINFPTGILGIVRRTIRAVLMVLVVTVDK